MGLGGELEVRKNDFSKGVAAGDKGGGEAVLCSYSSSLWEIRAVKRCLRTSAPRPVTSVKGETQLVHVDDACKLLFWNEESLFLVSLGGAKNF